MAFFSSHSVAPTGAAHSPWQSHASIARTTLWRTPLNPPGRGTFATTGQVSPELQQQTAPRSNPPLLSLASRRPAVRSSESLRTPQCALGTPLRAVPLARPRYVRKMASNGASLSAVERGECSDTGGSATMSATSSNAVPVANASEWRRVSVVLSGRAKSRCLACKSRPIARRSGRDHAFGRASLVGETRRRDVAFAWRGRAPFRR